MEADAYTGTGKMTKLEMLRWILNKNGHKHGIFSVNRRKNYISKIEKITDEDIEYINAIAKKENIHVEIVENKIYIK
jgi:DNA replicative helicase MCM subunit Mcm2 (Cdc46/Mcm family)